MADLSRKQALPQELCVFKVWTQKLSREQEPTTEGLITELRLSSSPTLDHAMCPLPGARKWQVTALRVASFCDSPSEAAKTLVFWDGGTLSL